MYLNVSCLSGSILAQSWRGFSKISEHPEIFHSPPQLTTHITHSCVSKAWLTWLYLAIDNTLYDLGVPISEAPDYHDSITFASCSRHYRSLWHILTDRRHSQANYFNNTGLDLA